MKTDPTQSAIGSRQKGPSESLADFVYHLSYESLPPEVVHQAKRCLLDYLGVALIGSTTETAEKARTFLSRFGSEGNNTVFGYGIKTEFFKATLINGITAHVTELDDGERRSTVHPGSSIIPALLSTAEKENADGRNVITALVAGYETALRIGRAIQPFHRNRGFHATATCSTFGAAMAAAKVLNLSREETASALGLAGTSASGLLQFLEDGSDIKQYHPGKAACNGAMAAYLAASGFTGSSQVLEGKRAFLAATTDDCKVSEITDGLGKRFAILDVYFKPYAACRHCHAPIEAVLNMRDTHGVRTEDVKTIQVWTYKSAVDGHQDPCPQTVTGAKLSLPFSVAVALDTGWAGPREFTPEFFHHARVLELAKKVVVTEEPALSSLVPGKRAAIVELLTHNGDILRERIDLPKGEPENPLTDEELQRKFTGLASSCRSQKQIESLLNIVENTEERFGELFPFLS